ncbi:ssDNA endodeoxyribonuclease [Geranomyces variabilis]|nr:ssDNA endodeoxyribonuclease [Geranomyces variabilis]
MSQPTLTVEIPPLMIASSLGNSTGLPASVRPNVFRAKLDDVRALVSVLKAVAFKDKANCIISRDGMRFVVEDSHASLARCHLQQAHFRDYFFPSQPGSVVPQTLSMDADGRSDDPATLEITFSVDIQTLLDCLTIFGGSSSNPFSSPAMQARAAELPGASQQQQSQAFRHPHHRDGEEKTCVAVRISCPLEGNELSLTLEEKGVVTMCQLTTFEPEPHVDLHASFAAQRIVGKVIMKSQWLRDAFSELDGTSDTVTLLVSPAAPYFRLSASGLAGDTQMDYPKDTDVVESFHCMKTSTNNYKYSLLQPCLRALALSTKSNIRINETGFLSMQFMVPINENDISFVEYLVSPLVDEEDGDAPNTGPIP